MKSDDQPAEDFAGEHNRNAGGECQFCAAPELADVTLDADGTDFAGHEVKAGQSKKVCRTCGTVQAPERKRSSKAAPKSARKTSARKTARKTAARKTGARKTSGARKTAARKSGGR
jgi:DNA end-binding protein Ku